MADIQKYRLYPFYTSCAYIRGEHMCIIVTNMKFLCLIELSADDDNDTNDAGEMAKKEARRTKHDCKGFLASVPNEPKKKKPITQGNNHLSHLSRGILSM